MKKIFILIFFISLLAPLPAFAHPPKRMTLDYDMASKTLTISMVHVVSSNRDKHYIKEVLVTKNKGDPVVFHYRKQKSPRHVVKTIPLDAKEGDTIFVRVNCSKGGIKSASIVIPKKEAEQAKQN